MAASSTFPLIDRILDHRLGAMLQEWRAAEMSFEDIALKLRSEHDVRVSTATVRRWVDALAEPAA